MRTCGLLILLLLASCGTTEEHVAIARVEHTPLAFDPTESYELARWWSNGAQLLRLDDTGGYALYAGVDRYHEPLERGSWDHPSYVELQLSPYDRRGSERRRVTISKRDGILRLELPDLAPMFALEAPPPAPEDELLGAWVGADGALALGADRRYTYRATTTDPSRVAVVAGHDGAWRLAGGRVILTPDPPNMGPYAFVLAGEPGDRTLRLGGMSLRRPR